MTTLLALRTVLFQTGEQCDVSRAQTDSGGVAPGWTSDLIVDRPFDRSLMYFGCVVTINRFLTFTLYRVSDWGTKKGTLHWWQRWDC